MSDLLYNVTVNGPFAAVFADNLIARLKDVEMNTVIVSCGAGNTSDNLKLVRLLSVKTTLAQCREHLSDLTRPILYLDLRSATKNMIERFLREASL